MGRICAYFSGSRHTLNVIRWALGQVPYTPIHIPDLATYCFEVFSQCVSLITWFLPSPLILIIRFAHAIARGGSLHNYIHFYYCLLRTSFGYCDPVLTPINPLNSHLFIMF